MDAILPIRVRTKPKDESAVTLGGEAASPSCRSIERCNDPDDLKQTLS